MVKKNLSEYTDRSEPIEPVVIDPRAIAERLGVPLIGGDQVRTEHEVQKPPQSRVVGVCAMCGLVITSSTTMPCTNDGCPSGLRTTVNPWDEYYDQYESEK